ncbi:MAG: CheB methylesterase domain-containing protein [Methanomicrobiales archaeon]
MKAGDLCPIIIIGSSTGGPHALEKIFSRVSRVPSAIVIVQHLSHSFVPLLRTHIHEVCSAPTVIPSEGDPISTGTIYIAPGGRHLLIRNNRIFSFSDAEKLHGVRPSIDVTMRSLRPEPGIRCMGILLTGMGEDGATGIAHIKKLGGITVVQEPGTCAIRSMPLAALATGSVDYTLTPDAVADMINNFNPGETRSSRQCTDRQAGGKK